MWRGRPAATSAASPALLRAGFDPLELGAVPANLARFREAELIHGRWAMLGAAGVIAVEALGFGDWVSAQTASPQTYFGATIPGGDNIAANVRASPTC